MVTQTGLQAGRPRTALGRLPSNLISLYLHTQYYTHHTTHTIPSTNLSLFIHPLACLRFLPPPCATHIIFVTGCLSHPLVCLHFLAPLCAMHTPLSCGCFPHPLVCLHVLAPPCVTHNPFLFACFSYPLACLHFERPPCLEHIPFVIIFPLRPHPLEYSHLILMASSFFFHFVHIHWNTCT